LNCNARNEECKLQTSLHMMMVSVEASRSRHVGFQISKTVSCFWSILYIPLLTSIIPDNYNTHLKVSE